MKYIVKIDYTRFRFKKIEDAVDFAESAKNTAEEDVDVSLIFVNDVEEED